MIDYLVSMGINIVLTAISLALKDPAKATALKKALIKVRDQINVLYPEEAV